MEDAYSACLCDDDISSLYPHQHLPETADLRIRVKVFSKNELLLKAEFSNSKNDLDNVYIKEDIYITLPIKESNENYEYTYTLEKNSAPIKLNEKVGTIEIYNSMGMMFVGELIVGEDIELINWFEYFWIIFKSLIV